MNDEDQAAGKRRENGKDDLRAKRHGGKERWSIEQHLRGERDVLQGLILGDGGEDVGDGGEGVLE